MKVSVSLAVAALLAAAPLFTAYPQNVSTQGGAADSILAANGHVLSLETCLDIALSQSPTVQIADMEVERVDYSKKETLASLLPSINFGFSYNRMVAKQVAYMNMDALGSLGGGGGAGAGDGEGEAEAQPLPSATRAGGGNDRGIKMGLDNSFQTGFQATLPLIAPQLWTSLKLNDAQILMAVEQARASRLQLVNQVKNAWYALLLAIDAQQTIRQSYDMALFTADIYEKQYSLGAASQYDVLRTQVAVRNIEPELSQAEIAIKQAHLQLCILMGINPADLSFVPDTTLAAYERTMYEDAMQAATYDTEGNTQLRQLDIQGEQLGRALNVNRAGWLPTLALTASYNWTSSSNGSPFHNFRWTPYSVVGLQLNVPLGEFSRIYTVKANRVQIAELELQKENTRRTVDMQVALAVDNINTNVKQIASCSESMRQANEAHRIAKESFQIGASSYLDLRDAELAVTRSQLAYYQAIYNYLVARADLELLQGNFDLSPYQPAK